jgi:hypothetical protein
VLDWLRGTTLLPYLAPLTTADQARLLAELAPQLAEAYPPTPRAPRCFPSAASFWWPADEHAAPVRRGRPPDPGRRRLMITAGAGMGVDSGLPDFRGNAGLWRAYPALAGARIAFEEIASPDAFVRSPALAWGFYGHRLNLYRRTVPHPGFAILQAIGARLPRGSFVFTSNVDGQFQRAGFDENRVCEVHGSIHHLQCLDGCDGRITPADGFEPEVDEDACLLRSPCPAAPAARHSCGPMC